MVDLPQCQKKEGDSVIYYRSRQFFPTGKKPALLKYASSTHGKNKSQSVVEVIPGGLKLTYVCCQRQAISWKYVLSKP